MEHEKYPTRQAYYLFASFHVNGYRSQINNKHKKLWSNSYACFRVFLCRFYSHKITCLPSPLSDFVPLD